VKATKKNIIIEITPSTHSAGGVLFSVSFLFLKGYLLFFKLSFGTQTAELFAPYNLL